MKSGHRLALTVWLALVASACLGAPSSAQKSEVTALNARIAELSRAGKYLEAIPLAQRQLATEKALDDALNAVQRGAQSSAAAAVNKLAVRLAAGNDRLAELVRRDQDLATEAEALDKTIIAAVSKEPSAFQSKLPTSTTVCSHQAKSRS